MATVVFTASENAQIPPGVTSITIDCWGAGGSGGASNVNGGGGGGGGGYSRGTIPVTPGETLAVTVAPAPSANSGAASRVRRGTTDLIVANGGTIGAQGTATAQGAGGAGGVLGSVPAPATNVVRTAGGAGGGGGGVQTAGGGGGGSGGQGSNGGAGSSNQNAGGGGAGTPPGAAGGRGAATTVTATAATAPGGGGGGGAGANPRSDGARGEVRMTYTSAALSAAAPLTLGASVRKMVIGPIRTSSILLTAIAGPRTVFRSRTADVSLGVAMQRLTSLRSSSQLSLGTGVSKRLTAAREFAAALVLDTAFARRFIGVRQFSAHLPLAVRARIEMGVEVLDRIETGTVNIVKKIIQIFDD